MADEIGPELEKLLSGLDLDRWREATGRYFERVRGRTAPWFELEPLVNPGLGGDPLVDVPSLAGEPGPLRPAADHRERCVGLDPDRDVSR